jgi:hypothetical protein
MTRRPHQTESMRAFESRACRINDRASRSHSVLVNVAIRGCIRIEVADGIPYSREVFRGMRAQQCDFVSSGRLSPFPFWMSIF